MTRNRYLASAAPASQPAARRVWLRLAALALAVGVLLCGAALSGGGATAADPLRIAVSRGPVSLPIYVAQARGLFAREGVDVQFTDCTSGRDCMARLGAGAADLATAAELMVTFDALKGGDAAILASLSVSARSIRLVGRRSAGIDAPQSLLGKRIATVAGTSAQYYLDSWLLYHGIEPVQVTEVLARPDELPALLASGRVDAVAIWEPLARSALAGAGADGLLLPQPAVYTQHFTLIASAATRHRRADAARRVLRALAAAERSIAEQPAAALQVLQARLGGVPTLADLAEHSFRLVLDQSLISTMDAQARWAVRIGLVEPDSRRNLLASVDPSALLVVSPAAVELVR